MLLFSAVHAAIVSALAPIGADPGCLANPIHGKNPLSPHWSTMVVDRDWPTLAEMMAGLKKYRAEGRIEFETSAEAALCKAVAEDLELSEFGPGSNMIFTASWVWSFELLRKAATEGDPAYMAAAWNPAAVEDWLLPRLADQVYGQYGQTQAAEKIVARCARERAWLWDPVRSRSECRRGAAADRVAGVTDMRKRMQIGAAYAAEVKAKASVDAIAEAMVAMRDEGLILSKQAVCERSGRGLTCVKKWWDAALKESFLVRGRVAVDRKQLPLPGKIKTPEPAHTSSILFHLSDGRVVVRTEQRMPVPASDRPGWTTSTVPVIAAVEAFKTPGASNTCKSFLSKQSTDPVAWIEPASPINLDFSFIDITSALAESAEDFDPYITILRPGYDPVSFDWDGNAFETWTDIRGGVTTWPHGVRVKQRSVSVTTADDAASAITSEIGRLRSEMHHASLYYESGRPEGLPIGNARPTSDLFHIVDYESLADPGDWGEAEDWFAALGMGGVL